MEGHFVFMIFLQVLLIALNAVFASAEIAVISINDNKLARMAAGGDKRAIRLSRLTSQPARFLATIQVAITLSGFMGSAFAAENFSDSIVEWLLKLGVTIPIQTLDTIAVVCITVILSYFTLIFGELVPKRIAMRKAEALALGMSLPIGLIAKLFAPIVWFLTASTNGILRLIGIDPNHEENAISEEEIRMMVDVGSEKGAIDPTEKQLIQNVFEFDDLTAREIATHRTEVILLSLEQSMDEWQKIICSSRHTLYPICNGSADNIVGILNAKDYFRLENQSRESVLSYAVTSPYFVPESVKADVLFRNMKRSHNSLAVVLDEYGGVCGIVTLNDLVEQLVGELEDSEKASDTPTSVEVIDTGKWLVHGATPIEEVAAVLGVDLSDDEYETFNGLVLDALGSIPQDGTNIEFETSGLVIRVIEIRDHRVEKAVVGLS